MTGRVRVRVRVRVSVRVILAGHFWLAMTSRDVSLVFLRPLFGTPLPPSPGYGYG